MFNKKLEKILEPVNKIAGNRIRKFAKDVQEDAWMIAYVAYIEDKNIHRVLTLWRRTERKYQKRILAFTRARPLLEEKGEIKRIKKEYY
jgi:hypothetical protein